MKRVGFLLLSLFSSSHYGSRARRSTLPRQGRGSGLLNTRAQVRKSSNDDDRVIVWDDILSSEHQMHRHSRDSIYFYWGIHLTGASARRAGNSPWSVRRRAFQAGWVPTGSRRRRWLHFGCGVNDEVSVAHRVVRDGELEHPVEHHPAGCGSGGG